MKFTFYILLLAPTEVFAQQPESSGRSAIGNIVLWAFLIGIGYWIYTSNKKKKDRIAEAARQRKEYADNLEQQYKNALKGTDKALALELGRAYYSNRRDGGALTIYDEQALTNDLSTMR